MTLANRPLAFAAIAATCLLSAPVAAQRIDHARAALLVRPADAANPPGRVTALDSLSTTRRRSYAGTGAILGMLAGGIVTAVRCSEEDCYVPVVPIVTVAAAGGGFGAILGHFVDRR